MRLYVLAFVCLSACGGSTRDESAIGDAGSGAASGTGDFKSSGDDQRAAKPYRQYLVSPQAIDPSVTSAFAEHQAFYPRPPAGKLLVYLPGTGSTPGHVNDFLTLAATMGYHAIDLSYPDEVAAHAACGSNINCYSGFRAEMFTGIDYSPTIATLPQDAIHGRLVALLAALSAAHPNEAWDDFLTADGDLVYDAIAFAGLSQGGGHAAWAGVHHVLAGVIMFSSADDTDPTTSPPTPATWITWAHQTPVERYFGFDHDQDFARKDVDVNWPALGMSVFGDRTPTDDGAPPYNGAHELSTAMPTPGAENAHGMVVGDSTTPLDADGTPMYRAVWTYMLSSLL